MNNNENKKELAIILGATGNMAFALGNVLIGLKKHSPNIKADFIVYEQGISQKDKEVLNSITNCEFREYNFPVKIDKHENIKRFTLLTFSRYEGFNLLNEYKNVLWLDIDTVIQDDIKQILDYNSTGIAMTKHGPSVGGNFKKTINKYDMDLSFYNAGVMLLSDKLKNPEIIAKWCYEKTIEYAELLCFADQGILNIAIQEFNMDVTELPYNFNAHPEVAMKWPVVVAHSFCVEKFWNYWDFKEWNINNKIWIEMGGTPYKGKKINKISKFFKKRKLPIPWKYPRSFTKTILGKQ